MTLCDDDNDVNDKQNDQIKDASITTHVQMQCMFDLSLESIFASYKWRGLIISFWLAFSVVGVLQGFRLLELTRLEFHPPSSSPASINEVYFESLFPKIALETFSIQVIVTGGGKEREKKNKAFDFQEFDEELETYLRNIYLDDLIYVSYYTLKRKGLGAFASHATMPPPFFSSNNTQQQQQQQHSIIRIGLKKQRKKEKKIMESFIKDLTYCIGYLNKKYRLNPIQAIATGLPVFSKDLRESAERELLIIDSVTFPVALVVLFAIVRSYRLLILPIISIGVVIVVSFKILEQIATKFEIISIAPSIMMSCSVAFSIDYSLFLLSRLKDEMLSNVASSSSSRLLHSVVVTLRGSGESVLISGLTLTCCWFVLLVFPVKTIASVGLGAGIATLICICVNLTLLPSIVLTFPNFFSSFLSDKKFRPPRMVRRFLRKCFRWFLRTFRLLLQVCLSRKPNNSHSPQQQQQQQQQQQDDDDDSIMVIPASSNDVLVRTNFYENYHQVQQEIKRIEMNAKISFQIAKFVTSSKTKSRVLVLICIVFIIPFAYFGWGFQHSNSIKLLIPKSSKAYEGLLRVEENYGPGFLQPFYLMISSQSNVKRKEIFRFVREELIEAFFQNNTFLIEGEMWFNQKPIPDTFLMKCSLRYLLGPSIQRVKEEKAEECELAFVLNSLYYYNGHENNTVTYLVRLESWEEPNSLPGESWYRNAVRFIREKNKQQREKTIQIRLVGGDALEHATIELIYDYFPVCILLTSMIVFLFITFAFQSIVVPARSIFTIGLTLCFVYGSASLVYLHGVLNFLNIPALKQNQIHWISPILLFGILVGLSLDFDVFLLTRIVEYRKHGFSEVNSIRVGLSASFKIITAAGLIMIIAFGGLFLSDVTLMNQIAFFLVTGIVFDTFFIRIIVVPSMMFLLEDSNFYPRKLKQVIVE